LLLENDELFGSINELNNNTPSKREEVARRKTKVKLRFCVLR